jgi:HK97 family phage major capsid protein
VPIEQCQTLGTKGDIYFVDFGQYIVATKGAMQSAVSIHARFIYDESIMRFVYRLDGQPMWNVALTPFKGSNTQSPYVTLAAR